MKFLNITDVFKIIAFFATFSVWGTDAWAVASATEIYAPYYGTSTCTGTGTNKSPMWDAVCNNSVAVKGVGKCSNLSGTISSASISSLTIGDFANNLNNKYCWCKVILPVVSKWVWVSNLTNQTNCLANCSSSCASYISNNPTIRTKLLTNFQSETEPIYEEP